MINWILGAVILVAAGLAIRSLRASRKAGGCAGCSGCGSAEQCPYSTNAQQ